MYAKYCHLLLVLLSPVKLAQAQESKPVKSLTNVMSVPLELPLLVYVGPAIVKPSPQDSLYQLLLSRQKVRAITKLRIRPGVPPDTLEYAELDRRGNKTMLYITGGQQRIRMKYDNQNRLLERVQLSSRFQSYQMVETLDPEQKRYASFRQEKDVPQQPLMTARQQRHDDTTITITQLYSPISFELPIVQTVCRSYRTHGDTSYVEVVGYDSAHQALGYEVYVVTRKAGCQTSNGVLHFQRDLQALLDTSAQARQWRSQGLADAEILMRRRRQLRGQLLLTSLSTYNRKGQLLLQESLNPEPLRTKPVTRTTENGSITLSSSVSSSVRYTYDKQGRLIKQETVIHEEASDTATPQANDSITVVKMYTPKGLLLTETTHQQMADMEDRMPTSSQYEYHYTYY